MAQKKVGFSKTGSVQADRLIVNNGLTASTTYNFYGLTAVSFNLPVVDGTNGQALKTDGAGNLSFGTVAVTSTSGTSGTSGTRGTSGTSGTSGLNGSSGSSGTSGIGTSGTSGSSGQTGTSGTSGNNGTSGTSGVNGTSGTSGTTGTSGTSGVTGTSGTSGINGTSGTSGANGTSGTSGVSGTSGTSGVSGSSGTSGTSGVKGATGSIDAVFIDGWLNTASYSTQITALQNNSNWTTGNTFSGSISSTYQGQRYFTYPYVYDAIEDNQWIRTAVYGTTGSTGSNGTSGTSGVNGTSGTSGANGTSGTSGVNGVGNATITGTTNYIPKFTGATALGNSAVYETNSQFVLPDGTGTTPSLVFNGNTQLGFFKSSGFNEILCAVNGTNILQIAQNTTRFRDGSVTAPGISFLSDTDTGIYRSGTNTLDFAAGGERTFFITDNNINVLATASQNSIHFRTRNDGIIDFGIMNSNTGLQFNRYTSGGAFVDNALTISKPEGDGGVLFRDGSAATPSISFQSDTDTGLFRSAANQIGFSTGGTLDLIIGATNSFVTRTYFGSAVNHVPVVNASVSGLYTIDMSISNVFNLTLTGNTTLDYSNSYEGSYVLLISQDGVGNRSLGLTTSGKFIGATAFSIATASNSKSLVQIIHIGTQSIITSTRNLTTL